MKSTKILSVTGIVLSSLVILASLTLLFLDRTSTNDTLFDDQLNNYEPANVNDINLLEEQNEEGVVKESEETIKEEEEREIRESGWIPNWGFDLGYESLLNNEGIIDTVMPVLYTVNKSGNVISRGVSDANINKLLTYCRGDNIRVIPTIGSYDFDSMKAGFASTESYTRQIDTILSEVEKYGFDGIDLDYEMINTSEKENFLEFLNSLGNELRKKNKILSVTVFPQWDNASYNDHQETRAVQDYSLIGRYADEVRIMAYDYTLQSSKTPGPIGPVNWIEDVLDYATKSIPKEKVWLGVHLYGYQWQIHPSTEDKTIALTYTTMNSYLSSPTVVEQPVFKEELGETYIKFGSAGGYSNEIYYQDQRGINMRRDIAKEYGIAGVAYWRLGGELDILK
jgi:spore germination protein